MTAGLTRALLRVLSPGGRRARLMIMTFHRVPADVDPMNRDEPDAAAFRDRMHWLRQYCNLLPLPEAAARLRAGTLPPRAASITFDDGYRNNLTVAAPILRELGLPATFFIAAGAIEAGIMWNDRIIEGIRRAGESLDLGEFELGEHRLVSDGARRKAIRDILGRTKYRPLSERWELAGAIYARATQEAEPRLMMTTAEVRELAGMGFDIGAHTINHPILKEESLADAKAEIVDSRDWVAKVTGQPVRSFAYPNGRPGVDYGPEHVQQVRAAGYEVAVSTAWGCATRTSNRFELPRFTPWEADAAGFGLRLVKTAVKSYLPAD